MKSLQQYRFQTALGVLFLAASAVLVGCGSNGAGQASADDANAGAGNDDAANPAGGAADGGSTDQTGGKPTNDPPLNSGEYTVESFGAKDDKPADFQPLNDKESTLLKRDETAVVVGGPSLSGFTLDDAGKAFAPLSDSLATQLLGFAPLDLVSANLDDDGADEIAVLGTTADGLVLRVVDHSTSKLYASHQDLLVAGKGYAAAHVRAADLDGDGRAELLVTASNGVSAFARVYDDATGKLALLKELKAGPSKEIAAALGNFDADLAPEIALLSDEGAGLTLQTFDDAASDFSALRTLDKTSLHLPLALKADSIRLEAGNFDADADDELAVFADGFNLEDPGNAIHGLFAGVLQATADLTPLTLGQTEFPFPNQAHGPCRTSGSCGWQTQVADLNGDGKDELVLLDRVASADNGSKYDWVAYRLAPGPQYEPWQAAVEPVPLAQNVLYDSPAGIVSVGQTEGLGRDVLVTLRNDSQPGATKLESYRVFVMQDSPGHLKPDGSPPPVTFHAESAKVAESQVTSGSSLWPVSGDFDGDSLRVRFTGKKWLELTRPRPMVILAAPPAKAGISQVTDNNSTSYGTSKSVEKATTEEYSITRNVTLSFELPIPGLDFLNVGAAASMGEAMSQSKTGSLGETYGVAYAASYPDNVVVFNGVLCMRYEYQVMGGADTELIGSLMTIDVPKDSRIYKWTTDYYNQALGDRGSPIDARVLPQNSGDPTSFPNATQRDKLMNEARRTANGATVTWQSQPISVGQGSGVNSVWIDLNETETNENSFTTSTEYSAKAGAFVSAEYSQGVDETAAYSVSVTRSTEYQGAVGDITGGKDYANWFFSYGLFVYPATLAKGERVQVVNYWTEGFGPGYTTK